MSLHSACLIGLLVKRALRRRAFQLRLAQKRSIRPESNRHDARLPSSDDVSACFLLRLELQVEVSVERVWPLVALRKDRELLRNKRPTEGTSLSGGGAQVVDYFIGRGWVARETDWAMRPRRGERPGSYFRSPVMLTVRVSVAVTSWDDHEPIMSSCSLRGLYKKGSKVGSGSWG